MTVTDVFMGEGILGGRKKSIHQVGSAIRTGVRLGSITKETALNSEWGVGDSNSGGSGVSVSVPYT